MSASVTSRVPIELGESGRVRKNLNGWKCGHSRSRGGLTLLGDGCGTSSFEYPFEVGAVLLRSYIFL